MAIDKNAAAVDALFWWRVSPTIALLYVLVIVMFIGVIANNFRIMAKYTKPDSDLSATIGNLSGY